ncbi:MAG: ATP-binding protein, partial [Spirulina sp. SIO3F2]|nr:ATP-binding protein [Spirulina sp. SIO3F2]
MVHSTPLNLALKVLRHTFEQTLAGQPPPTLAELLANAPDSLHQLGQKFQLLPFEQGILLLCAALELEPNFQTLCAEVQGNPKATYATLSLALALFPEADWSVLSSQSPLHHWQLIHTEAGRWLAHAPLQLDRRILCYLLGTPDLAAPLVPWLTPLPRPSDTLPLSPTYQALSQQIVTLWSGAA